MLDKCPPCFKRLKKKELFSTPEVLFQRWVGSNVLNFPTEVL